MLLAAKNKSFALKARWNLSNRRHSFRRTKIDSIPVVCTTGGEPVLRECLRRIQTGNHTFRTLPNLIKKFEESSRIVLKYEPAR